MPYTSSVNADLHSDTSLVEQDTSSGKKESWETGKNGNGAGEMSEEKPRERPTSTGANTGAGLGAGTDENVNNSSAYTPPQTATPELLIDHMTGPVFTSDPDHANIPSTDPDRSSVTTSKEINGETDHGNPKTKYNAQSSRSTKENVAPITGSWTRSRE